MSSIFIPKTITAGFQNRSDTYDGKLAYVIYTDEKGVLRKENSWNSWRDKEIEPVTYDNVPTSGFVLNKKAGGYSTGWNHRQTYVRVYDPRGMEFEISIPNLLYILENTNSIKGKGLEGEFIYGWDGTEILLIPTSAPDYQELIEFNKAIHNKQTIKVKDLKVGATYKTKQNEDYIYMGRFDYHSNEKNLGKHHFFAVLIDKNTPYYKYRERKDLNYDFIQLKSLGGKLIDVIDENCVFNYADIFSELEQTSSYSPVDKSKDEYIEYTYEEFVEKMTANSWNSNSFYSNGKECRTWRYFKDNQEVYTVEGEISNDIKKNKFYTLDEIYNTYKPCYLNRYLANGILYRRSK